MVNYNVNKEEFTYLLTHPEQLTSDHTEAVGAIVSKYPYFQSARALYLKGLKTKESFKYNQELKITAAYTTDRSILFDFITSEAFNQNEISRLIKENTELLKAIEINEAEDISVNKSVVIDKVGDEQIKNSQRVFDPGLFEPKSPIKSPNHQTSSTPILDIDVKNISPSPETQLGIGKPLNFEKNETHSFTEWLNITSFKPIERTPKETAEAAELETETQVHDLKPESALDRKLDLIDKFISTNPKITPIKQNSPTINLAQTKLVENDSLMTETLARIYLEQKNYDKAIQSYKILILKYPEKSSFFADQIKAVKQLQENNTK